VLDALSGIAIKFCDSIYSVERGLMNLLSISPAVFRTYAEEYKKLARSASDEPQVALFYLKIANMWEHAALRFENGFEKSITERDPPGGERS
jgi:hypothetical protein